MKIKILISCVVTVLGAAGVASGRDQQGFIYAGGVFTDVTFPGSPYPGATDTVPTAINDSGEVTGYYSFRHDGSYYAFTHINGAYTDITSPGPYNGHPARNLPISINNSGAIATQDLDNTNGYIYSVGIFTDIVFPGAANTGLSDINDAGTIIGQYNTNSPSYSGSFIYTGGNYMAIAPTGAISTSSSAINNSGEVAGSFNDGVSRHGFVYAGGVYTTVDFPGSTYSALTDINGSGESVGSFYDGKFFKGFLYAGGAYTAIDVPGSAYTTASDINDSGVIVGQYGDHFGHEYSFIYENGTYTTVAKDPTGATRTVLTAINDSGVAVGYVDYADPAPEPATWAMILVGVGGLGAVLRSRRQSASDQAV